MGIEVDGANQKLILDSDGDTYLEAATDDTIKVYIAGAHDATISANAINVLSGTTLTIDSGATITNSGTANGFSSADPSSADGDTLGTASAEWSDLYLADGGIVYFGNAQDIRLTHNADKGLILKHSATADDKPVSLTLQTGETDIAANDIIGKVDFQAPDEAQGTDAILVAAGIEAVSEGDFSSSNNATKLSFKTAASEAAAEKMSLSSAGILTIADDLIIGDGKTIGSSSDADAITIASDGDVTFSQKVGIGTAQDLGVGLHIRVADTGGSVEGGADELVIENTAACGLSIVSGNSASGNINFADGDANSRGIINYDHNTDMLNLYTNGSLRVHIDNNGYFQFGSDDKLGSGESLGATSENFIASGAGSGDQFSLGCEATLRIYCAGTQRFNIASNGDLTATDTSISAISDERLKKDIADYTYDIDKFKQLRPRTFTWKNGALHTTDTNIRGFVAQEVKLIDNYWIGEEKLDPYQNKEDGQLDLSDIDLIPADGNGDHISFTSKLGKKDAMYVSIINQLIAKIETLETKVKALEDA